MLSQVELTKSATPIAVTVPQVLRLTYGLVPIVAGIDKFTNLLTDWTRYLNPVLLDSLPFSATTLMHVVGVIEILAGLLVLFRPRVGAWVVMAWLLLIAMTLLASGNHYDVAVRDVVMAIGAWSLAKLSAPNSSYQPRSSN